mgnify:CR=1 FL=1
MGVAQDVFSNDSMMYVVAEESTSPDGHERPSRAGQKILDQQGSIGYGRAHTPNQIK